MVLADQETVTLRFDTDTVGWLPAGMVTALAIGAPAPSVFQAAYAAAAGAAAAIATAMTIGRRAPMSLPQGYD
jgi:hypothetical protein